MDREFINLNLFPKNKNCQPKKNLHVPYFSRTFVKNYAWWNLSILKAKKLKQFGLSGLKISVIN